MNRSDLDAIRTLLRVRGAGRASGAAMQRIYKSQAEWLGATVEAHVEAFSQGLTAVWRVAGVVTTEMLPEMLVDALSWHEDLRAFALVADYREAAVSASLEHFLALARVLIKPPNAIAAPMVIVPSAAELAYFHRYAARMCDRGVTRVVELDFSAAQAWAQQMATVRRQEGFLPSAASRGPPPPLQRPAPDVLSSRTGAGAARKPDRIDPLGLR